MDRIPVRTLLPILIITGLAIWLDLPDHAGIRVLGLDRRIETQLGLDLVGGTQTLLEADLPPGAPPPDGESMQTARQIVERRVNGLGVAEAVVQLAGERRILVELPGVEDPQEAIATIRGTALLEFVDFSAIDPAQVSLMVGQTITTDFGLGAPPVPAEDAPPAGDLESFVFPTILTGAQLRNASATTDPLGGFSVQFELTPEGADIFSTYTAEHLGEVLAIVLDKEVISVPVISAAIPSGQGVIEGDFTLEEANNLAIQLRYGALPVPLKVVESRTVGPTLGQDSLQKSLVAGAIGLAIVMSFMILYYRLPGVIADLSLLVYAATTFALFRTIPVTLTLAGIAGLMLSTGSALDANILIFERLKEELRSGKNLNTALEIGWRRAWPSIRDSNFATLITCTILFWFGSSFGATIVQGFALTLFIGVVVSLFSAVFVTRSFLNTFLSLVRIQNEEFWFGL